jgi:hypothetical protein
MRLISKVNAFDNGKMTTRSQFYQLALEANEKQANAGDDVLPVPTLDERVNLYLQAVHGNREFTEEERSNARNVLLDSMAAEIAAQVQPEVGKPRPLHPYEAPTQYRQSVRRKETTRFVPIARRRASILALTATLGLILIVAGGTRGYRWTNPYLEEEISGPSQQDRVPPPTTSPRSLSSRPASSEQHVVKIASRRSEAEVLAFYSYLQEEHPSLFAQAILKRIDPPAVSKVREVFRWGHSYTLGPFASEKDAAAACLVLAAADIRCDPLHRVTNPP